MRPENKWLPSGAFTSHEPFSCRLTPITGKTLPLEPCMLKVWAEAAAPRDARIAARRTGLPERWVMGLVRRNGLGSNDPFVSRRHSRVSGFWCDLFPAAPG